MSAAVADLRPLLAPLSNEELSRLESVLLALVPPGVWPEDFHASIDLAAIIAEIREPSPCSAPHPQDDGIDGDAYGLMLDNPALTFEQARRITRRVRDLITVPAVPRRARRRRKGQAHG